MGVSRATLIGSNKAQAIAVMVAFNRSALLRESLAALAGQTYLPYGVIVVNNASTDDTLTIAESGLQQLADLGVKTRLINLTENTGGAGGFVTGIAAALVMGNAEWVWVMDDDTVPNPEALEHAMQAHERYKESGLDDLVLMGSRALWTDGDDHPMNIVRQKPGASAKEKNRTSAAGGFPSRTNSFVSAFLRSEVVRIVGLPIADYFIWNDDFEHTLRMGKKGCAMLVQDSTVVHKTAAKYSSAKDPGPRFFNEVRNKIWVFRFSRGFKRFEKVRYIAKTARRWAMTLVKAENKSAVVDMIKRGFSEGFGVRPRSNATVLAGCGVPDDVMRVIVELDK